MKSDKKFIKKWEKDRVKGKPRFILINSIYISAIFLTVYTILTLLDGHDLRKVFSLPIICGLITGCLIGSPIAWDKNEEKYNRLLKNK